jgi:hypothetical protein
MNEQVMYWIGAASNRPQISNPMEKWVEGGGTEGGLWMLHNYVKQVREASAWIKCVKQVLGSSA